MKTLFNLNHSALAAPMLLVLTVAALAAEPPPPDKTQYHLFNIEHEIAFHGKLYEITGNETMKKFQKMLKTEEVS